MTGARLILAAATQVHTARRAVLSDGRPVIAEQTAEPKRVKADWSWGGDAA